MDSIPRLHPARLAEKLRKIREALKLSQDGILIRLGFQGTAINRASISGYELGDRRPPYLVLYAYANLANVFVDVLLDDDIDLPNLIPATEKSTGKRKRKSKNKKF